MLEKPFKFTGVRCDQVAGNESHTDRYTARQRGVHIEMDGLHYLGDEA